MRDGMVSIARLAAATVFSFVTLTCVALLPTGVAHAGPGATFTIVNNTGKDMWLDEWFLETPASATFGPGRVPPGSYTVRTKNESQLQARFTLGDQRRAMVMMQVAKGVAQIQCNTNYGNCSPRNQWANDTTATFTP